MKVTKVIYLRRNNHQMTKEEIADSIYVTGELGDEIKPHLWTILKTVEIDIPDSLIDDIIYANTKEDIDKKIAKHLASITQLEDFRSKGK